MILFVHGPDTYSSSERLKQFVRAATEKNGCFNVEQFFASDLSYTKFVEYSSALPFLGDKRILVIRDLLSQGSADFCNDVCLYLKNFDRSDFNFIFYESGKIDKRKSLYKFLSKDPVKSFDFPLLEGFKIDDFIKNELSKLNASISNDGLLNLRNCVGGDLERMKNEILKLSMYSNGRIISSDDVSLLVDSKIDSDVFKMIGALSNGDFIKARKEFSKLLSNGESEFYLFTMLVYQFRNLIIVKDLCDKRVVSSDIAKVSKLHPFVVKNCISACSKFKMNELRSVYSSLLEIDLKSKTVSGFSLIRSIDLFMYSFCR